MTAALSIDPDAPQKAIVQKAELLKALPSTRVVMVTLAEHDFKLPLIITGDALDQIRSLLIDEALKAHLRAQQIAGVVSAAD